jgi:uncharacterized membrane protein YdcZ (DUF606 family)
MTQALYILTAVAIGLGAAVQVSMVASLGRLRGPVEATWISLLATVAGVALVFAVRSLRSDPPGLPSPFDSALLFAAIAAGAGFAMIVSLRGLETYLALTGLFGFAYLMSAGYLAPRIGIALFASAVTAGTLFGSVLLDHVGAFGGEVQRINLLRVIGVLALFAGVLLVRGAR